MDDTYEDALLRDGRDLVAAARDGLLSPAFFREAEVQQVLDALERGRSVLMVGPDGVGKSAIAREVARRLAGGATSRGLVQLSTGTFMVGTRYLGEWQSKATQMLRQAARQRIALYLVDPWHLPRAGATAQSTNNLLDLIRPFLESGEVVVLGEAPPQAMRLMEAVPGFLDLFVRVQVEPLPEASVDGVLERAAHALGFTLDDATRHSLIQLSGRFLPKRPQPAPALGLLERVADYQRQKSDVGEPEAIDPAFVEKVLSIYSGLPRFVVSSHVTRRATELRAWFAERIVGQEAAIDAVVETIALFKAGLHDPNRPIGTLLFVGPTGVGKTEVARALATLLFGSPNRLLRFDLSEFKDFHAFEMLVGAPDKPGQPARLVDPVLAQPFQVVLLDELEKAHPNVWDLLLPLLDEGRLTTPDGRVVDFRSTILIATSNAGAQRAELSVGFGGGESGHAERQRAGLEQHFRPELLNRFQHIVPFRRLSESEVRRIARQELGRILAREGITGRNLVVEVDDGALDVVTVRGVDRKYGARALKRELQRQIVLPVALHLMEHDVAPGQILKVSSDTGHVKIRLIDTPESRAVRRQEEPIRLDGRRFGRAELVAALGELTTRVEQIADAVDEAFLRAERARLLELRSDHAFWEHKDHAARALRDLDQATVTLDRVDRLRQRAADIGAELPEARTRDEVERIAQRVRSLEDAVGNAWLELVCMGVEGAWDALVEVAPLGGSGRAARELLLEAYLGWARYRRVEVDWLRVPRADDEPAMLLLRGHYAHGLLKLEAGLHRVRTATGYAVARVRVAPFTDRAAPVAFGAQRAIKGEEHRGVKIRSRVECVGGLVLQNARTMAENRDLAVEVAGPWADAPPPVDVIVRRYDTEGPLVRDVFTGESFGRPDALAPERLHGLLARRVEEAADDGPQTA